jgi:hypothetical protein
MLTDVAGIMLLRKGLAPIHCSAFRKGRSTVVVLAPPNTGKTLTAMMACTRYGADFLAEDLAVTDGRIVYAVPWTSTFRYSPNEDRRGRRSLTNSLIRVFPPLELLSLSKPKAIDSFLTSDRIVDKAAITHVAILERGTEEVRAESADEAFRKALNLNRYEFCYHKSPLVVAYEFFNPGLNIDGAYMAERSILRRMVENAQECLTVRTHDAARYAKLLDGYL